MVEKTHSAGWLTDFLEPFQRAGERISDWFAPRSDAVANGTSYEVNIELPGVKEEDIDIQLHDNVLTVKGEKRVERKEEGSGWFFSERQYGRFQRSFRLPPDTTAEGVAASFADGVLTIRVPKRGETPPEARKISIGRG